MKLAGLVMVTMISSLAGCATVSWQAAARGTVLVTGPSGRAFAAGPAVVHLFSMEQGGEVYMVSATTGTDADCARPATDGRLRTPIEKDRMTIVEVGNNEIACVLATRPRPYELLWHGWKQGPTTEIELAQNHRQR